MRSKRTRWLCGTALGLGGVLMAVGCYHAPLVNDPGPAPLRTPPTDPNAQACKPSYEDSLTRRPGLHDVLQLLPLRADLGRTAVLQFPDRRRPHAGPGQPDGQGVRQAGGVPGPLARRAGSGAARGAVAEADDLLAADSGTKGQATGNRPGLARRPASGDERRDNARSTGPRQHRAKAAEAGTPDAAARRIDTLAAVSGLPDNEIQARPS